MNSTITPPHNGEFLVPILRNGCGAVAGYAAMELLDTHPELSGQFGPDAFAIWKQWYTDRIEDLTGAVASHCVDSFVEQVRWAQSMLLARGVSHDHLRPALESLHGTLLKELPDVAHDVIDTYLQPALDACVHRDEAPDKTLDEGLTGDTPASKLAAKFLVALLEGDRRRATQLLQDAAEAGQSTASLMLDVLTPAMREVGRMWMAGEISIAEEHFITATARETLMRLVQNAPRKPSNGKTVLTAAVAGNHHDLGLQMVADLFELDGWRAINLGANVPAEDIAEAAAMFGADIIVLSAALGNQLPSMQAAIQAIRTRQTSHLPVLVGGAGFPASSNLAQQLGADGHTDSAQAALDLANQLVAA